MSTMENGQDFVDLYALLQVRSTCDSAMLDKAYRYLAHRYHPDHPETADVEKFQEVVEAYRLLKDPEQRRKYDEIYAARKKSNSFEYPTFHDVAVDSRTAIDDAEAHEKILSALYKRRREHAEDPGVMAFYLQRGLECSEESFEFHMWYLKSKGYIEVTEDASLAITIEGVDHVISRSRDDEVIRLLSSQHDDTSE